jgi:hypothetical protein
MKSGRRLWQEKIEARSGVNADEWDAKCVTDAGFS